MSDADFDDFDDTSEGCPNCGGDGVIYMCFSEYACFDPEGGCDLCERRCDWCRPKKVELDPDRLREDRDERRRLAREDGDYE